MISIKPSTLNDLDFACALYKDAIDFQKRNGFPEYRWDDREAQKKYIENGCHYKLVNEKEILGVFNIQQTDPLIWREMEKGDALYLHGVLIHTKFKGQRLLKYIIDWTVDFAKSCEKKYVRLDTWDDNPSLINYYQKFDFEKIESFQIPNDDAIPLNCRGNKVMLMEYKI